MRDDLKRLYRQLLDCLLEKITLFDNLLSNMRDKHYYLKSGDVDRITAILSAENDIISHVDLLDYEIGIKIDAIAIITGIPRNKFIRMTRVSSESEAKETTAAIERIHYLAVQLSNENEKFCSAMSNSLVEIKRDFRELQDLISLSMKDIERED